MLQVTLPKEGPKPLYYDTFVMYTRKILEYNSIPYHLEGVISPGETTFLMPLSDGRRVLIDFSDHVGYLSNWKDFDAYFKFHYVEEVHKGCEKIYPFAPVSFYDWKEYEMLKSEIEYKCNSDIVLNMQCPYGNAMERRSFVQRILKEKYNRLVMTSRVLQSEYWKKINNCLVHVFVPGARNDMLDRGHVQYMAFGCCTIAPPIMDILPYEGRLVPEVHYVQCEPDYSDLIARIEWCKSNRNVCVEIGKNAKQLFGETCVPEKLWDWIMNKVGGS